MDKKGEQSIGMVVGLIGGIAFLIIGIIIAFTVVGTINTRGGADLIPQISYSKTNESQLDATGALVYANTSGFSVNGTKYSFPSGFVLSACWADYNQSNGTQSAIVNVPTGYNTTLSGTNCSLSTAGNVSATTYAFPNISISYTFTADDIENMVAGNLSSNFSSGVQNISSKIPTILLVAAVILIVGVLGILVAIWVRLRLGGQGSL